MGQHDYTKNMALISRVINKLKTYNKDAFEFTFEKRKQSRRDNIKEKNNYKTLFMSSFHT